jgi:acetyl-CoA carboxylase biotin carboxyl carrier protein
MPLSEDDIREILRLIDESELAELRIETEAFSLYVRRSPASDVGGEDGGPRGAVADSGPSLQPSPAPTRDASPDQGLTISAPMLGTFYRAEAPGAPRFVELGAHVEPNTIVCLIEVMKMMHSIPAGVAGTVVEVCVENAQLVEHGAPLFRVEPER